VLLAFGIASCSHVLLRAGQCGSCGGTLPCEQAAIKQNTDNNSVGRLSIDNVPALKHGHGT